MRETGDWRMKVGFTTLNLNISLLMIGLGAFCFIVYYLLKGYPLKAFGNGKFIKSEESEWASLMRFLWV